MNQKMKNLRKAIETLFVDFSLKVFGYLPNTENCLKETEEGLEILVDDVFSWGISKKEIFTDCGKINILYVPYKPDILPKNIEKYIYSEIEKCGMKIINIKEYTSD